jgi:hypothetical protein
MRGAMEADVGGGSADCKGVDEDADRRPDALSSSPAVGAEVDALASLVACQAVRAAVKAAARAGRRMSREE